MIYMSIINRMQAYNTSQKQIITMKITTFLDVTPCSLVEYLYISTLEMEAVRSSMTSVIIYQIARFHITEET
jgi:hypothetical protein